MYRVCEIVGLYVDSVHTIIEHLYAKGRISNTRKYNDDVYFKTTLDDRKTVEKWQKTSIFQLVSYLYHVMLCTTKASKS